MLYKYLLENYFIHLFCLLFIKASLVLTNLIAKGYKKFQYFFNNSIIPILSNLQTKV